MSYLTVDGLIFGDDSIVGERFRSQELIDVVEFDAFRLQEAYSIVVVLLQALVLFQCVSCDI